MFLLVGAKRGFGTRDASPLRHRNVCTNGENNRASAAAEGSTTPSHAGRGRSCGGGRQSDGDGYLAAGTPAPTRTCTHTYIHIHTHTISHTLRCTHLHIQYGADVNKRNTYGSTLLHQACHKGHMQIVAMLLELGSDPNTRNSKGQTPLHLACQSHLRFRKQNLVKLLLDAGTEVAIQDKYAHKAIFYAEKSGCETSVDLIKSVS